MIKNLLTPVLLTAAVGASAQHDTMYLIKGDRVVGKYAVEDVDYATFTLPDNVSDDAIWFSVDNVTKNSVTYTVNTANSLVAYAHNLVSIYDVDYMALDFFSESFEQLSPEQQDYALKLCLQNNAYVAMGSDTFTQRDFDLDNAGEGTRFSVTPGTRYFLCAWQLDPATYEPLEGFFTTELTTDAPAKTSGTLNVTYSGHNAQGAVFDIQTSGLKYIRTVWGFKSQMDPYIELNGLDLTLGFFGQPWDPADLQGIDEYTGLPKATWPTPETGDYVFYVRGYDNNGDIIDVRTEIHADVETTNEGPSIKIISKEKGKGFVNINVEITPSNVEEAYARLMLEDDVDDRLNMGYEIHELAMGGDADDITNTINTTGEYTFSRSDLTDGWYSFLITALDKDGNRTTQRINFWPDTETQWSIPNPVSKSAAKKMMPIRKIKSRRNPSIEK